jgi:hypothetical protein
MPNTLTTKLKIESFVEIPYHESSDGSRLMRVEVVLAGSTDLTALSYQALAYSRADGTSTYATLLNATATLDGHTGSFVLQGAGGFDGVTTRLEAEVVTGSGTDALAGIGGSITIVAGLADLPFLPATLTYTLD